jgi:selenocysteine-specific elongation factor
MTIDLGFAWTTIDDEVLAFVDVPGHERFVTNMLAGVGPVPAVLLVVAADEGWRRQTTEHVDALAALGVRHAVVAVTRSDLADPGPALAQVEERLATTPLTGAPVVAVSPVTGSGMDTLRTALRDLAKRLGAPPAAAPRLWVDRVFSVHGAGTIVTGTLASGSLSVGDTLALMPADRRVGVRGVESLKQPVSSVTATARVAVNLRGLSAADVSRGDALVAPGAFRPVSVVDVRMVRSVLSDRPSSLMLHIGSAAVTTRVRPLGRDIARLSLAAPLPLHVGDAGLLRDPGQHAIAAGIVVLDVLPPELSRRGAARSRAVELAGTTATPDPAADVTRRGAVRRLDLVTAGVLEDAAAPPVGIHDVDDWLVSRGQWSDWTAALDDLVTSWATEHPLDPHLPRAAAVASLQLPDPRLLDHLVAARADLALSATGVCRAGATARFPAEVDAALTTLLARLADAAFVAPEAAEIAAAGLTEQHLAVAAREGRLLRLAPGIYLGQDAPQRAVALLAGLPQPFTVSQARQALATTRRVAVPLLELLDNRRLTRRTDSTHRLVVASPGSAG